jgi:hypothetical protein
MAGESEVRMSGENVSMRLEGSILVIEVDLNQSLGLSASGKSEIIASTGGNVGGPGQPEVKVGLNVYRPRKQQNGNWEVVGVLTRKQPVWCSRCLVRLVALSFCPVCGRPLCTACHCPQCESLGR